MESLPSEPSAGIQRAVIAIEPGERQGAQGRGGVNDPRRGGRPLRGRTLGRRSNLRRVSIYKTSYASMPREIIHFLLAEKLDRGLLCSFL